MLGAADYRGIRRLRESKGEGHAARMIQNWFEKGEVKPQDFRLSLLAEATIPDFREMQLEFGTGGFSNGTSRFLEAGGPGATTSGEFSNITGQIVYSAILESFEDEEFVFSKEVGMMPSAFLTAEKIAGIGKIGDEVELVEEGQPYPYVGPVEDYIHAPEPRKRGNICALTWEAVFSDRTGDLLNQAAALGYGIGLNKEKRIIDAIVDENDGAKSQTAGGHRYRWRDTDYATFQTTSPWDNVTTSNGLTDWTDVEGAELAMSRITDPNTGEPIKILPDCIIVTKQLEYTARYILQSTALAVNAGGYATSGTVTRYETSNFLPKYKILTSRLLETRMATDTDWYLANLKAAVKYKEIRPIQVTTAPPGHPAEFERDIVNQWKASEFGAVFVAEPRVIHESRA